MICVPVLPLYVNRSTGETEEFFTSYDEVFESFDDMGLQENLLRGIYAYGRMWSALFYVVYSLP